MCRHRRFSAASHVQCKRRSMQGRHPIPLTNLMTFFHNPSRNQPQAIRTRGSPSPASTIRQPSLIYPPHFKCCKVRMPSSGGSDMCGCGAVMHASQRLSLTVPAYNVQSRPGTHNTVTPETEIEASVGGACPYATYARAGFGVGGVTVLLREAMARFPGSLRENQG